jgi:hypothetical protein
MNIEEFDRKMVGALAKRLTCQATTSLASLQRLPSEQADAFRRLQAAGVLAIFSVVDEKTETYHWMRGPKWPVEVYP